MDKKKKIIVAVVTLIFVGVLLVFVKIMLFPSGKPGLGESGFTIITPKVDERKIDSVSKIDSYEQESYRNQDNNAAKENETVENSDPNAQLLQELARRNQAMQLDADEDLRKMMALQEERMAQQYQLEQQVAAQNSMSTEDLESIMRTYEQYMQEAYRLQQPAVPAPVQGDLATKNSEPDSAAMAETRKKADERLANATKEQFSGNRHFQGAGTVDNPGIAMDLIPAETVDQSILFNGSTIAIRTKKAMQLKNPALLIPEGAVVYGRVAFAANRLSIDIVSYKEGDKLYPLNFKMFDFDGREGVHLGNRTWPKIPSQVAQDVYNFAYQRGTQATAFGLSSNNIDPDQLKNIAILSASREISKEVFDKRRILMPKKYQLWINVSTN